MNTERALYLADIKDSIQQYGFHITCVGSGPAPRFLYTTGLLDKIGCELVLAGGLTYLLDEAARIVREATQSKLADRDVALFEVSGCGQFSFVPVHLTWSGKMLLAAKNYYDRDQIPAQQIVPPPESKTIDVPDMQIVWSATPISPWKWLGAEWEYNISPESTVGTNIRGALGKPITEIVRWEDDYWEMFDDDRELPENKGCIIIPIGTMIGSDPTLEIAVNLPIGSGFLRTDARSPWVEW